MAGSALSRRSSARAAVMPLVLLWLAAHALLLGLFLTVKLVSAKLVALALLTGTVVWLVWPRARR